MGPRASRSGAVIVRAPASEFCFAVHHNTVYRALLLKLALAAIGLAPVINKIGRGLPPSPWVPARPPAGVLRAARARGPNLFCASAGVQFFSDRLSPSEQQWDMCNERRPDRLPPARGRQTTNLGVGGSNPSGRARNPYNMGESRLPKRHRVD
jgi:hypothetical protein